MAFENFPYTDLHTLNVDWIIRKLKELEGAETTPVDVSELDRRIRNQAVCLYSGTGILTLNITNVSGMSMSDQSRVYREKENSSMNVYARFENDTGSEIPASTALMTFDSLDVPQNIAMLGIVATIHNSDGTELYRVPYLYWDTNYNKAAIRLGTAIPAGSWLLLAGQAPLSASRSLMICRGNSPATVAGDIANHMLNGVTGNSWAPGDFAYSNSDTTRLDPLARATDCSGMIYLAFKTMGLQPSRGSLSETYWSDGIVLAYADVDEDLDLSNALPGDIIIYHAPGDRADITHCTLYAGGDVVYEMAYTYPDAEHAIGIQDHTGPYAITSTPAHAYRKDTRGRYLVRVL